MATDIVKSVGTAGGRDYSTIAAFSAALPASLVTADETWTGECYNDSEFTDAVTFSGSTTDATHWVLLTTATGQSFADHADKLTNALNYDQSKGVGLSLSTAFHSVNVSQEYTTLRGIQIYSSNTSVVAKLSNYADATIESCIIKRQAGNSGTILELYGLAVAVNCLVISGGGGVGALIATGSTARNLTVVTPSDVSNTSEGFKNFYGTGVLINCASFGFDTDYSASGWDTTNSKNNASDSTGNPGTASQDSLTFADQFEAVTTTGIDLRVKSGSGLIDNGVRDATYTLDLDIIGQDRSLTTPTIGCWEFVSAGGVTGKANPLYGPFGGPFYGTIG